MNPFRRKKKTPDAKRSNVAFWLYNDDKPGCPIGYTTLDNCPEIVAGCRKIASIIGATTIWLMANSDGGDERIINELSRQIDIDPMPNMTRSTWMEAIVMNLLLYGKGNSVVVPHTFQGLIQSLEPISASRVSFEPVEGSYRKYIVNIDGKPRKPDNLLHFVYNPDKTYMWMGKGVTAALKDIVDLLKLAADTEKAFMSSEYKPSVIVKVDALTDEFAGPAGRRKLIESYIKPDSPGEPWIIPAEQFSVEQIRPLTLSDLAIADTIKIDKRAAAALLDIPAFVLGVGDYNAAEWNYFIQTRIMSLCKSIAQELTKKLIIKPEWYLMFNIWSMLDFDIKTISAVMLAGADRGYICGDEWRDRLHLPPAGLKEFKVLENYIPYDMSGQQKKLVGNED